MKHEKTTLQTKMKLVESLKKAMKKKAFSKISVSEIVSDCDINRKTFYYHFEDIYALLKWMFEQEAIDVVRQFDLLVDYEDAILFIMDYVEKNHQIINCVLDSIAHDELKRFFYSDFIGIMGIVIDGVEEELDICVDKDFKDFVCKFYTEAVSGILIDWCRGRKMQDKDTVIKYITFIFNISIPNILSSFDKPTSAL